MKIIYRAGSFLDAPVRYFAHGCNAQGVMGAGAAKAVKGRYPEVFDSYVKFKNDFGLKLGDCQSVITSNGNVVFNLITQEFYGRSSETRFVSYDAVEQAIRKMDAKIFWLCCQKLESEECPKVAMPMIGTGFGGGSWRIISAIIEEHSRYFQPVVYVLDGQFQVDENGAWVHD